MICATKSCPRCLRMDAQFLFKDRENWFKRHKVNCDDRFVCTRGECANRPPHMQNHFTMCLRHYKENRDELQAEFIQTLDAKYLPDNVRFFFNEPMMISTPSADTTAAALDELTAEEEEEAEILPDSQDKAIYMLQNIEGPKGEKLLVFFDSGCFGAGISTRACSIFKTVNVRPGPTTLDVAGGGQKEVEYGDQMFLLPMMSTNQKSKYAAVTALQMDEISTPFPVWRVHHAWSHLNDEYTKQVAESQPLPEVEREIGGSPVDIILGVKYSKLFPLPLFHLPSGLSISRSALKGYKGKQGVLSGPYHAWGPAMSAMQHCSIAVYFQAEFRAYRYHTMTLFERVCVESEPIPPVDCEDDDDAVACADDDEDECEVRQTMMSATISKQVKDLMVWDSLGSDVEYRCGRCRACAMCNNAEKLEKVSLQEEAEQALIESCVYYDHQKKKVVAKMPFIQQPDTYLADNRYIATRVLESQIRMVEKQPALRPQLQASHEKLRSRGFVARLDDLPPAQKKLASQPGYFLPWRHVHSGSLSTPCRLVFDASSRTKTGHSLNCILAKGSNTLASLLHLLIRFRIGGAAFTADVSMAYNAIEIEPEYFKFQKYLWSESLTTEGLIEVMVVLTLIYGVRSSGNLTIEGFRETAKVAASVPKLEATGGPKCVEEDMYLDDALSAHLTDARRDTVAAGFEETLSLGQMSVKAITKSGSPPDEKVSQDGKHVSVVGYNWEPEKDLLSLDIKPLYFGKAKRGKLPTPVQGEILPELKKNFTRRNLAGRVAGVFDPLGLVVPVTAKLKTDLSVIVRITNGWDELIDDKYLPVWMSNLMMIQELAAVTVPRSLLNNHFEVGQDVDLLISTDASEMVAVAAVYIRWQQVDGRYKSSLLMARSKLVSKLTVPRAELRACAMGACLAAVATRNCKGLVKTTTFVTDSTVALSWIECDQRPLQVGVRNQVIQVRRFSSPNDWFHIESVLNPADVGTRPAEVVDVVAGSVWQDGHAWMTLPRAEMPIKKVQEITMSNVDKVEFKKEVRATDVQGIILTMKTNGMAARYLFSDYILDPCSLPWDKFMRRLAVVCKIVHIFKHRSSHFPKVDGKLVEALNDDDVARAERYLFKKTTAELLNFVPKKKIPSHTIDDGIVKFTGRILDGEGPVSPAGVLLDVTPGSFIKPILDRHSPVAFSLMVHCHSKLTHHGGAIATLRMAYTIAYVMHGKSLAVEVQKKCYYCRRFKPKKLKAAMGPQHSSRMCVAPPFFSVQVDLFGPILAHCAHGRRSTVKHYAAVYKCPTTLAVSAHVMETYDTPSFLDTFVRFSSRYGVPKKLYIDAGSQLLSACRNASFSMTDITSTINGKYGVMLEFEVCPVADHEAHGAVERSIRQIKEVLHTMFQGFKMDSLKIETALAWATNQINSLPLCIGNHYVDLDHMDLISPARLLLGRNNTRSPVDLPEADSYPKMMEQNAAIEAAWFDVWEKEKIITLIPQPYKWKSGVPDVKVNDVVVFIKDKKVGGGPLWKVGIVDSVETSRDEVIRRVNIRYRLSGEQVNRYTRRSVRSVAVVWRDSDLDLPGQLSTAQAKANVMHCRLAGGSGREGPGELRMGPGDRGTLAEGGGLADGEAVT